jgi:hypothetical protein
MEPRHAVTLIATSLAGEERPGGDPNARALATQPGPIDRCAIAARFEVVDPDMSWLFRDVATGLARHAKLD